MRKPSPPIACRSQSDLSSSRHPSPLPSPCVPWRQLLPHGCTKRCVPCRLWGGGCGFLPSDRSPRSPDRSERPHAAAQDAGATPAAADDGGDSQVPAHLSGTEPADGTAAAEGRILKRGGLFTLRVELQQSLDILGVSTSPHLVFAGFVFWVFFLPHR